MTVYDCRKDPEPGAIRFPCNVRVLNPADGERIANVFYLATSPAKIGRFVTGPDGTPMVDHRRKKRWVDDGRGGKKVELYYERLEVWEYRPWVAVAADDGRIIAKSEGTP